MQNKATKKKGPPGGCLTCGGDHYDKQCPTRTQDGKAQRNPLPNYKIIFQQRIHTMVDNRQEKYQITPNETTGMLYGNLVSILIDTRATENFISPIMLGRFPKRTIFMANAWLVEYTNQSRSRVEQYLFKARVEIPSFIIKVNLYMWSL